LNNNEVTGPLPTSIGRLTRLSKHMLMQDESFRVRSAPTLPPTLFFGLPTAHPTGQLWLHDTGLKGWLSLSYLPAQTLKDIDTSYSSIGSDLSDLLTGLPNLGELGRELFWCLCADLVIDLHPGLIFRAEHLSAVSTPSNGTIPTDITRLTRLGRYSSVPMTVLLMTIVFLTIKSVSPLQKLLNSRDLT
jgi:hypothetical protein